MNSIRQLPKNISDKIAAGEVVTSPLSVVKELVENSIDAGATRISVEIENGGKTYIRVIDDGSGIAPAEAELAFAPHATSKISTEDDLASIATLGFRGEALSSIAAVSRLEMVTKTADEKTALRIVVEGGGIIGSGPVGAPDGTTVTVRDLFYNTPARMKFMKSDRGETTKIVDLLSRIAVAYPDKRISLSTNGTMLFTTPGRGDTLRTILTVFGGADDLIPVEAPQLRAWISGPNGSAKTRRGQVFFVNGRYVKDDIIAGAVADAYKEFMFEGRYPLVYLFLEIDPSLVDVNVHPTKSEIKFSDAPAVRALVKDALTAALKSKAGVPKARTPEQYAAARRAERAYYALKENERPAAPADTSDAATGNKVPTVKISDLWNTETAPEPTGYVREDSAPETSAQQCRSVERSAEPAPPVQQQLRIDSLTYIGAVFGTYIIASDEDSLYLIDLHAAHERVNYERLMNEYTSREKLSQELLTPEVITIPASARTYAEEWAAWLTEAGFAAEIFGEGAIFVKSVPAFLGADEALRFLGDIIGHGADAPPDNHKETGRIVSRACRSSVRAGGHIGEEDAAALLKDLAGCGNPYTCPHGRPVFIRYSTYDLDRLFKRT